MRRRRLVIVAIVIVVVVPPVILAAGYVGSLGMGGYHEDWRKLVDDPLFYHLSSKEVAMRSLDGIAISAWWLPTDVPARPTIILAHGSQGNRSYMLPKAAMLVRNKYNVLALDLRAHGRSGGDYMTSGYLEYKDILGAVNYLRSSGHAEPIILMGYSYSANAALSAASRSNEVSAVIADSPYISSADMLPRAARFVRARNYPLPIKIFTSIGAIPIFLKAVRLVCYWKTGIDPDPPGTSTIDTVPNLRDPAVLILVGDKDSTAPPENDRRLLVAMPARRKSLVILQTSEEVHEPFAISPIQYEAAVQSFLNGLFPPAHAEPAVH